MRRSRFFPALFSAGLILAAACSDAVGPKSPPASNPGPQTQSIFVTLTGTVHLSGTDSYRVVLSTIDGREVPLAGGNADMLISVANAGGGVDVRGQWDEGGVALQVGDFLVRTVAGGPVVDGVLIALYDAALDLELTAIGYAIRPTNGAATIKLTDPPADLLTHLNERLWVAGADNAGGPIAFGVIGATQ